MTKSKIHVFALPLAGLLAATAVQAEETTPVVAASEGVAMVVPLEVWQQDPTMMFAAGDIDLNDFKWIARPIVIFADSPADPAFQRQIDFLTARADDLAERDVVIITDTDPSTLSPLRRKLRPRGFMLALIGKDGQVKLRKPLPWDVREISRSIDKMPMRKQELRDQRSADQ